MNNFTVCFTSPHYTNPDVFLNILLKMTPGKKGVWKNMTLITDPMKADFVVCTDGYPTHTYPIERTLFFAQHPQGITSYKTMSDVKGKALGVYPADSSLCMGEWWIEEDYDTLMNMEPPKKDHNLCSVTTYRNSYPTYSQRIKFLEAYVHVSNDIDVYGRQKALFEKNEHLKSVYKGVLGHETFNGYNNEHMVGKGVLKNYRYSLDFDHGNFTNGAPLKNYFSERFFDSMLLWAMPLYFGCDNVHDFLPENSFRYVDIRKWNDPEEIDRVYALVRSSFREDNIDAIKEARYLLLNKYSTIAMAYEKIMEKVQ